MRSVAALGNKMEIVRELQNGHTQRTTAEKYGVTKSTVGDIWKYRHKLEDRISSSEIQLYAKRHCVVCKPKYDLLVNG